MDTTQCYKIVTMICVTCSLALTLATYVYSYAGYLPFAAWSVNRGWPLPWAIEMHTGVTQSPLPAFYPFSFQAMNFALDLIFWATVLLLPPCLFLYWKGSQTVPTSRAWDGAVTIIPSKVQRQYKSSKGTISQVTLYVKSSRIKGADRQILRQKIDVTLVGDRTYPYPYSSKFPYYDVERITHFDIMLPKDQQAMMEDVKELSLKYNFKIEVVDLAKINALARSRLKSANKIKTLPAMVTDSGETYQGVMTKQQMETCFFKVAQSTGLPRPRKNL